MPPSWAPDERARFYLRAPRLLTPLFILTSFRLYREVAAASASVAAGVRQSARHAWNVLTHMFGPTRMARRIFLLDGFEHGDLSRVSAPTLVVTGDPHLDRVMPVPATREYLRLIPHARLATLERTGHLGFITRPHAFVELVVPFVEEAAGDEPRRRVG